MDKKELEKFLDQKCDCKLEPDDGERFGPPMIDRCGLHEFAAEASGMLNDWLREGRPIKAVFVGVELLKVEKFLDDHGLLESDNAEAPSPPEKIVE
jgi:hypothetical protein